MVRAPRCCGPNADLLLARLAADDHDPSAMAAFAAAVTSLRELSTPYHLAHGLLDHAQHLISLPGAAAAVLAVSEARAIAGRLRCQSLLDRAAAVTSRAAAGPSYQGVSPSVSFIPAAPRVA
jgi:hypothetical protein